MAKDDSPVVFYDVVEKGGRVIDDTLTLDDARDTARRVVLNGHDEPDVVPSKTQPEPGGVAPAVPEGLADGDGSDGPPNKSASRDDWDDYARSQGIDPDDYSTKDDLIDAVT